MKCWMGHDIVEVVHTRRPIPWYEFVIVFLCILSVVGLPILYFVCKHTYFANDWFINGICARCDKTWFDYDTQSKRENERSAFVRAKRDRFDKLATFRKKALGE